MLYAFRLMERCIMKGNDAKQILGDDKVIELFLMGNSASISATIRSWLMQAKFYGIPADKFGDFLAREVLWQENVYKAYQEHLVTSHVSAEQRIDIDSNCLF